MIVSFQDTDRPGLRVRIECRMLAAQLPGERSGNGALRSGESGRRVLSIGSIPMLVQRRTRARDEWLRTGGQHIQANFETVESNTSIRVNGSCPYRIACQLLDPATNHVDVFKSHNIWFHPSEYISGKPMDVIVDPHDHKKYVVETSFLPKLAE
jgi:hypothetical protein